MSHPDEIVISDEVPEAHAGIAIGDIISYLPILDKLIQGIKAALQNGSFEIPIIRIRIFGKHLQLGPIPVKVVA